MNLAALLRVTVDAIESEVAALPAVAEAGRVFSATNEQALRVIVQAINTLLAQVQQAPVAPAAPAAAPTPTAPMTPESSGPDPEVIAQESVVPLTEAAKGGKGLIKVIDSGWGTSGYYGSDVLERDAPIAFPAGTKMYWDHPTSDEAKSRPERSLRDLAAETTGPARWMKDGPDGPAVYAPASVFSAYRSSIEELSDNIGVSIRASAHIRPGEAEGRKGSIVERLLPAALNSIDFVTIPGRGGRVAALFEAARGRNVATTQTTEDDVSEAELKAAQNAQQAAEARAAIAENTVAALAARALAGEVLRTVDIPDVARESIIERLASNPPMKDGALDRDAFTATVTAEAAKEKAYIDRLTGRGEVRNMGSGTGAVADPAALAATFQRLGLSESAAKTAAAGRR